MPGIIRAWAALITACSVAALGVRLSLWRSEGSIGTQGVAQIIVACIGCVVGVQLLLGKKWAWWAAQILFMAGLWSVLLEVALITARGSVPVVQLPDNRWLPSSSRALISALFLASFAKGEWALGEHPLRSIGWIIAAGAALAAFLIAAVWYGNAV